MMSSLVPQWIKFDSSDHIILDHDPLCTRMLNLESHLEREKGKIVNMVVAKHEPLVLELN